MVFKLVESLRRRLAWTKAVRLHRTDQHQAFLSALAELEDAHKLNSYQLALKANSLLLIGRHQESRLIFSQLASSDRPRTENSAYIRVYAKAMLADLSGDKEAFARIAAESADISCSFVVRQNLPL
jgi:hypothetical protein